MYSFGEQVLGLAVIGFAGDPPTETPARRGVILAKGDIRCSVQAVGNKFELDQVKGPLMPTVATQLKDRCPAKIGWVFLIVSEAEHKLIAKNNNSIARSGPRLSNGNIALYCEPDVADLFTGILTRHVKKLLIASLREHDPEKISKVAWWLSRSAIKNEDVSAAAAALDHVGNRKAVSTLMDACFHSLSQNERARLFLKSRSWVDRVTR
jgi:hypothetical protein